MLVWPCGVGITAAGGLASSLGISDPSEIELNFFLETSSMMPAVELAW